MGKTRTALDTEMRVSFTEKLMEIFEPDAVRVENSAIALPVVDSEGNDSWVEITVKVPKGEKIPNTKPVAYAGYDGYAKAQAYAEDVERKEVEKAEKKAKADKAKAKKEAGE